MRWRFECPANRYVFMSSINCSESTAGSRRWSGSEFQTVGPSTENARVPKLMYVLPGVSLVCLFATIQKTTDGIGMTILPEMHLVTKKNASNYGKHPHLNLDPRILGKIFQHREIRHFPRFGSYLWKSWPNFHENFVTDVSSDKKSPLNSGSQPDCEESVSELRNSERICLRGDNTGLFSLWDMIWHFRDCLCR